MDDPSQMSDADLLSAINSGQNQTTDYSKMSDSDLLNAIQDNSKEGSPNDPGLIKTDEDFQKEQSQPKNPNSTGNIGTDIAGDLSRGFLNGTAQSVDIVNGVSKMLKNATSLDISGNNLTNVSNQLKQLASQQPQSQNPIVSGIGQFVGGVPPAIAQFVGTGEGIGFVARSAALAAADDYNKNQNFGSAIKSGAVGGAVGAVLDKAPDILMGAANVAKKWGQTSGKEYLQSVTGANDTEAQELMDRLNTMDLNPKSKNIENQEEVKKSTQKELDALAASNKELVKQQIDKHTEEYNNAKEISDNLVKESIEDNKERVDSFKANQLAEEKALAKSTSDNMLEAVDASTKRSAQALLETTQNVAKAKLALENTFAVGLNTVDKKASSLEKAATDDVSNAYASLENTDRDFVPTSIVAKEMDDAIGAENSRYFRKIGKENPELSDDDISRQEQEQSLREPSSNLAQIAKSGNNPESLVAAPGIKNSGIINFIKMTNDARHGLVDEFPNGRTSLAAMSSAADSFEVAAKKGFFGTAIPEQVAVVASRIKKAINPTRLYEKYPQQLEHLKPLAEANKRYSTRIDNLRNALNLYKDTGRVDGTYNPDRVFKAFERNDTDYLARLKEADKTLPPEDRIFDKFRDSYTKYKAVEVSEKSSLEKTEQEISNKRKALKIKFDEMKDKLEIEQRKQLASKLRETRASNRNISKQEAEALKDLASKQKQAISVMQAHKDKELEALQTSVNTRLHELHLLHMARSERAARSSNVAIAHNVSEYRFIDGASTFNIPKMIQGKVMSHFTSPIGVSGMVRDAINAPEVMSGLLNRASKIPGSMAIKKLVAAKASGR